MEVFFCCMGELLVGLLDVWLTHKVVDARKKSRDDPEEARFNLWLTLLIVGLVALCALLLFRFTGCPRIT